MEVYDIFYIINNLLDLRSFLNLITTNKYYNEISKRTIYISRKIAYITENHDNISEWAAAHGDLDMIKYVLVYRKNEFSKFVIDIAAEYGHLYMIEWLFSNNINYYTPEAFNKAAENGHIDVFKYLYIKDMNIPHFITSTKMITSRTLEITLLHRQINIANFILNNTKVNITVNICRRAIECGDTNICNKICNIANVKSYANIVYDAIDYNNMELLIKFHNIKNILRHAKTLDHIIKFNRFNILKWLYSLNKKSILEHSDNIFFTTAVEGNLRIMHWLLEMNLKKNNDYLIPKKLIRKILCTNNISQHITDWLTELNYVKHSTYTCSKRSLYELVVNDDMYLTMYT